MNQLRRRARTLAYPLILLFVLTGLAGQSAAAGMIDTETVVTEQAAAERAEILATLERDDVREKLVTYGVSPDAAAERVARLSDTEARELAQDLDELPAGGSTVTILLVVILLILILR